MADEAIEFKLPLEWHCSDDIISHYANNMVVQRGRNEFILSFFETRPPLVIGTPEEQRTKLAQVKSVRAECVARLIIHPSRMKDFVEVLRGHLEKIDEAGEVEE